MCAEASCALQNKPNSRSSLTEPIVPHVLHPILPTYQYIIHSTYVRPVYTYISPKPCFFEASLRSSDFWRLRIGIGRPAERSDVADFVLEEIPEDERAALERIGRALPVLLDGASADRGQLINQASASSFMNTLSRPR